MRERCRASTRLPTAASIRLTWWYLPSVSVRRRWCSATASQAAGSGYRRLALDDLKDQRRLAPGGPTLDLFFHHYAHRCLLWWVVTPEQVFSGSLHASAGTMRGREEPITLTGYYTAAWGPYSSIGSMPGGEFRFLAWHVQWWLTVHSNRRHFAARLNSLVIRGNS